MNSDFDAMAAGDLAGIVGAAGEFSEPAIYVSAAGGWRRIYAIVDRQPAVRPAELQRGLIPTFSIVVANDSTTGISSNELDISGDGILVARRAGEAIDETSDPILLGEPAEQDAACLVFRIGRRK